MASVWTVEVGEYSDHHVVGIFTSEANARLVADKLEGCYADVIENPLDPAVEELNAGLTRWRLLMLRDGTVEEDPQEEELGTYSIVNYLRIWWRTQAPAYKDKGIPDVLQAIVWAKNTEHAVKIVNEHRIRMIAMGEWDKAPEEV